MCSENIGKPQVRASILRSHIEYDSKYYFSLIDGSVSVTRVDLDVSAKAARAGEGRDGKRVSRHPYCRFYAHSDSQAVASSLGFGILTVLFSTLLASIWCALVAKERQEMSLISTAHQIMRVCVRASIPMHVPVHYARKKQSFPSQR